MAPVCREELQQRLSWHPPNVHWRSPSNLGWACPSVHAGPFTQTRAALRDCTSELKPAFDWVPPEGESKQWFQVQVGYLKGDPGHVFWEMGKWDKEENAAKESVLASKLPVCTAETHFWGPGKQYRTWISKVSSSRGEKRGCFSTNLQQ